MLPRGELQEEGAQQGTAGQVERPPGLLPRQPPRLGLALGRGEAAAVPDRRRPVPVEGSEFDFETDIVVYAIGTNANPIMGQTSSLALNKWGYIGTDGSLATSVAGVFAGGDIVTGAATVIEAMGAGRKAARSMKAYLGIRDPDAPYHVEEATMLFGIDAGERNFARVRVAG